MDPGLKQRLVGAAVLIALAVIFLPMLVQGPAPDSGVSDLSLQLPDAPQGDYVTRDLPLVVPGATGEGALLREAGGDSLATVDTATAAPEGDSPDAADLAGPDLAAAPDAAIEPEAEPAPAVEDAAARQEPAARSVASQPAPQAAPEPPKPAPAAPRLPAATAAGGYAVHFGAYATRADAGTVVAHLRGSDLPAYVEAARVGDRDAWRVRIGPYASRAEAEAVRVRASGIDARTRASVVTLDAAAATAAAGAGSAPAARPARSASTAAAAPAAAGTGFAIQVGAFVRASDANVLRDRLRAGGVSAFTETVQTERGVLTRVKAGPVATRAEADQLQARLASGFGLGDVIVRPHP